MANFRGSKLKKKKEKRKKKKISHLPDDLWRKILDLGIKNSKFTYKDLCCISITCKRLHRLSNEDSLWNPLLSSDFPNIFSPFLSTYRSSLYLESLLFDYSLSDMGQRIVNNFSSSSLSSSSSSSSLSSLSSSSSPSSAAKSYYKIKIEREREIERDEERLTVVLRSCEVNWFTIYDDWLQGIEEQRRAEMETIAAVLSKIQEIELTEQNEKRKPTVAEYFNLPKVKCNGYECVPDRRYPREKRTKVSTRQWKCWYQ